MHAVQDATAALAMAPAHCGQLGSGAAWRSSSMLERVGLLQQAHSVTECDLTKVGSQLTLGVTVVVKVVFNVVLRSKPSRFLWLTCLQLHV